MSRTLGPGAAWALWREARIAAADTGPLLVTGVLAEQLARELGHGAQRGAVVTAGRVEDASVLVRVLAGAPTPEDEEQLRAASRARTPVLAVQTADEVLDVPYVLATDVVPCPPGASFPVAAILEAVAHRLGERGTGLAARLPALRAPLSEALIETFSRKNGVLGIAVFVPGADLPVLLRNQLRLVGRIAAAHGVELDASRAAELGGTVAAGFALRAVARQLLAVVPVGGWAVKGGVAYAGTRAIGEAAQRYFAALAADRS